MGKKQLGDQHVLHVTVPPGTRKVVLKTPRGFAASDIVVVPTGGNTPVTELEPKAAGPQGITPTGTGSVNPEDIPASVIGSPVVSTLPASANGGKSAANFLALLPVGSTSNGSRQKRQRSECQNAGSLIPASRHCKRAFRKREMLKKPSRQSRAGWTSTTNYGHPAMTDSSSAWLDTLSPNHVGRGR